MKPSVNLPLGCLSAVPVGRKYCDFSLCEWELERGIGYPRIYISCPATGEIFRISPLDVYLSAVARKY